MVHIEVRQNALSDGSNTYDVGLTRNNLTVWLSCVSQEEAYRLAYAMQHAINSSTDLVVSLF